MKKMVRPIRHAQGRPEEFEGRQAHHKIVECVPNFSEGRDKKKIFQIAAQVKRTRGVKLLDVSSDKDHNRTVITFAGTPRAVQKAAFLAIAKTKELIDMSCHKGGHPRIGACDVCPFVPISGLTMEECVKLAKELAAQVGANLEIPVYLYEEAAARPERKNLAAIRSGEYEGLEEKLKNPFWKPDFGPAVFNKKTGATVIGARHPLIAFNVNLQTSDKKITDKIAKIIRESNGGMKAVKAIGVFLKEYGICQVSMNLTNYKITPLCEVFEAIKRLSPVRVLGSEIVGLVPKEAILMSGKFYLPKVESEKMLIRAAIENLGLHSLKKFTPKKKIIEYLIGSPAARPQGGKMLQELTVKAFLEELAAKKPTPGSGSAAALLGALAAALVAMAAEFSGNKQVSEKSKRLMKVLVDLIDRDAQAFAGGNLKEATEVPLQTARYTYEVLKLAERLAGNCHSKLMIELVIAVKIAVAAAEGASLVIKDNLASIEDEGYKEEIFQVLARRAD